MISRRRAPRRLHNKGEGEEEKGLFSEAIFGRIERATAPPRFPVIFAAFFSQRHPVRFSSRSLALLFRAIFFFSRLFRKEEWRSNGSALPVT